MISLAQLKSDVNEVENKMKRPLPNKRFSLRKWQAVSLLAVPLLCHSFHAHAALLLLEGPISALTDDGDGTGSITVMGVTVDIPVGTPITTPTASLDITAAADATQLPGRTQAGFIGGTAIIEGSGDLAGGYRADSVFLEPAENILGAETTSLPGGALQVAGVSLSPTGDARIPNGPLTNVFGFEVDPTTVPQGAGVVSEGYLSNDGSGDMKYFAIEVDGGTLVNAGITEISILRAQCLEDGVNPIELRVEGAIHDFALSNVSIADAGSGVPFGTVTPTADVAPFGVYSFVLRDDASFTVCPASVTATFISATTTAAVN